MALTAGAWDPAHVPVTVSCCNRGPRLLIVAVLCSEVRPVPPPGEETGAQRTELRWVSGETPREAAPGHPSQLPYGQAEVAGDPV